MSTRRMIYCPGCGTIIVLDDAACTMKHAAPQCETFAAICRATGMKEKREPWVEVIGPDGRVKTPGDA